MCINCARPVVFDDRGWRHRDDRGDCPRVSVAWPPPVEHDDDSAESAA